MVWCIRLNGVCAHASSAYGTHLAANSSAFNLTYPGYWSSSVKTNFASRYGTAKSPHELPRPPAQPLPPEPPRNTDRSL